MVLPKSHTMILSAFTAERFLEVSWDPEIQMNYAMIANRVLVWDRESSQRTAEKLANLEVIKHIRDKAEKGEPISVIELDECIEAIKKESEFLGWVYENGSTETKSLLRANSRGGSPAIA
jgi:hypothetical protein